MIKALKITLICTSILLEIVFGNEGGLYKSEDAFFKRFSASGFGYISYFRNDLDLGGESMQYRFKIDSSYDIYEGYLAHLGLFFSQGSSTPNANSYIYGSVHGSRGGVSSAGFSDRFGIGVFGLSKAFELKQVFLMAKMGRFNLNSPFSNNKLDLYSGLEVGLKYKNMEYFFLYSLSYMTDHLAYGFNARGLFDLANKKLEGQRAANIGLGNPLFIAGIKHEGDYFQSMLYVANSADFFDSMIFAQASFKQKIHSFSYSLNSQLAYTKISTPSSLKIATNGTQKVISGIDLDALAQHRGVYNLNIHLKYKNLKGKIGFLNSFGDGYGVLLNSIGGLDLAGSMWQNNFTATYEGFGILGSGGYRASDIYIAYTSLGFEYLSAFMGMDFVFIGGNNFFPLSIDNLKSRDFIELTPHIKYMMTRHLELVLSSSWYFLDFRGIKTKLQIQYKF